jgi:cell division protein ZapA
MKQLEVQIMGQSYLLGCPEGGESRLLEAVERVDTAMCKIREAGKVKARDRIAVLAALNLAFDVTDRAPNLAVVPGSATKGAATKPPSVPPAPVAQSPDGATDSDVLLISLLERLDQALGEDGRLL